jgi:hypothetical protein
LTVRIQVVNNDRPFFPEVFVSVEDLVNASGSHPKNELMHMCAAGEGRMLRVNRRGPKPRG